MRRRHMLMLLRTSDSNAVEEVLVEEDGEVTLSSSLSMRVERTRAAEAP